MKPGLIDVGQLATQFPARLPVPLEETSEKPLRGHSLNGKTMLADAHLSVAERLAIKRLQRGQQGHQQPQEDTQGQGQDHQSSTQRQADQLTGVTVMPLGFTLDLIYELTHNQRQYRPDKETSGVNVSILHLPDVVGTAIERIQSRIPVRCGRAPICTACVEWGLKGLGQYPAVQRLLYLKTIFREREEHSGGEETEKGLGLTKGRSGRSLYGIRGQELHRIFRSFEVEFGGSGREPKEGIYMPLTVYTDLKDIACYGLGMELQDGALLTIVHTLVDIATAGDESTKGIVVEEDRLQMRAVIDRFLDHAQVRSEAAEALMVRWGMLESREESVK